MFKHTAMERQLILQQEKLAQAVISLTRGTELEGILRHVGELSMELTGARYAMISYVADEGRHYIPLGMGEEELARLDGHWPEGKGLLGLMWEQHEVVRIADITTHPRAAGFPPGHAVMHTFLGAPILFEEEIEGVIYLTEKAGGHAFTPIDETIVRTLASACAVAISNARHIARLEQRNRELEALIAAGR
ncbi:MAG: GAF domain-containing protein [Zetaproteobacteria bacterium]|nr:MAG: GAF domain-containing protein [Zetaproteobacteria bacterium]